MNRGRLAQFGRPALDPVARRRVIVARWTAGVSPDTHQPSVACPGTPVAGPALHRALAARPPSSSRSRLLRSSTRRPSPGRTCHPAPPRSVASTTSTPRNLGPDHHEEDAPAALAVPLELRVGEGARRPSPSSRTGPAVRAARRLVAGHRPTATHRRMPARHAGAEGAAAGRVRAHPHRRPPPSEAALGRPTPICHIKPSAF